MCFYTFIEEKFTLTECRKKLSISILLWSFSGNYSFAPFDSRAFFVFRLYILLQTHSGRIKKKENRDISLYVLTEHYKEKPFHIYEIKTISFVCICHHTTQKIANNFFFEKKNEIKLKNSMSILKLTFKVFEDIPCCKRCYKKHEIAY